MSRYHYAQPEATRQYSDNTRRHKSMAGVMMPVKRCSVCDQHKQLEGSTRRNGKFVCAGCK